MTGTDIMTMRFRRSILMLVALGAIAALLIFTLSSKEGRAVVSDIQTVFGAPPAKASAANGGVAQSVSTADGGITRRVWKALNDGKSLEEGISGEGYITVYDPNCAPTRINNELIDFSQNNEFYANSDYSLIGFIQNGDKETVLRDVIAELETNGWTVSAESQNNVTLFKEKGECRWVMLEFAGLGQETSVVLHTAQN